MVKCSNCSEDAIKEVKWKDKSYCFNHFKRYFLGQVGKVLYKYDVEGEVGVALSAGKDSSACLDALTHFDELKLIPFFIDLGIGEYSEDSLEAARKICDKFNLDLEILDLEREYGVTISEVNREKSGKICGLCGMIKRYLMNRFAYENDLDYVATGHNLSDEISSTFNNLANVYLTPFRGLKPVLEENLEFKMVARVKPLYFLKDDECSVYAEENELPIYSGECPFSTDSPTNEFKEWVHALDSERPKTLRNFAKSFMRIEEKMEREQSELGTCESCGYPTATKVCRFCRTVGDLS